MNPTLYDGKFVYWSRIIVSGRTSIKAPLAKNTPLVIENADPIALAFEFIADAKSDPFDMVVVPYVKSANVIRVSPSTKVSDR